MKTHMRITAFALAVCMVAALAPAALAEAAAPLEPAPVTEGELVPGMPPEDVPVADVEDVPADEEDVVVSVEPAGDPSADDVPLEAPDEVIEDDKDLDAAGVTAFVQRLYRVCMGREADASGLNTWTTALLYGGYTGASTVKGFFDSKEYKAMNRTDAQYVGDLYRAMFDREGDTQGVITWTAFLDGGMSRDYVFSGFVNGTEFKNLCARYGITPGSYASGQPRDQNPSVTAFVNRLYQVVFGRKGDVGGLNDWTGLLNTKANSGAQVVQGFMESGEYTRKNTSDDQYITDLYRAMFDRTGDAGGIATWKALLTKGVSRTYILKGFAEGVEFKNLCARYNITQGAVTTSEARDVNPNRTGFANNLIKYLMGYTNGNTGILNLYAAFLNGGHSASQLVDEVLKSNEYAALTTNLSASQAAVALYNGLLGRENDISGYEQQNLASIVFNSGLPAAVQTVLKGDEFKDYCARCELAVGTGGGTTDPDNPTPLPGTLTIKDTAGNIHTAAANEVLAYIVMGEVGGMNNAEVFKAQCVAAYSYLQYQYNNGTATPTASWSTPTQAVRDAVNAVAGQMLTYNGQAALTSYYASGATVTNTAEDVWGTAKPYLVNVASPYDTLDPAYQKTFVLTADQMSRVMHEIYDGKTAAATLSADMSQWLTVVEYGPNYMAKRVQFGLTYINDNTQAVISNPKPRGEYFMVNLNRILGVSTLPSVNFVVAYNGNGTWTFTSYGRGHGVGMSQYGAYGYATREGWNYRQILAHYFPGTTLTK